MSLPKKCLVDTNVPKTANLATHPDPESDVSDTCVLACIEAVEHVTKRRCLILDADDEIYNEYRKQLSMRGQPGMGDAFMKWVNNHRHNPEYCCQVTITKNEESYNEFPIHDGLNNFDKSDRKFVAVANAHADKPPILQATDSKWWGWKDALAEVGISVTFLCPTYVKDKYAKKMGT
jgi:hypothetical protein